MTYIRYLPSPPLNAYIDYLYYLDGPMPYPREKILPLPTLDLKINLEGTFHIREADHAERSAALTDSWWVGLWSRYHALDWPPRVRFFGVHFKAYGAYPLLRFPLSDLHNRVVPLDAIWGRFADEIRERLGAAPTIQAGFARLERWLLARLCEPAHGINVVQYAIAEIKRHQGALSIRALSDHIGISENHLGTLLKRMVGVPPKELARLYRFEHVLRSVNRTQLVVYTLIAHQSRYYDQSHFNKDFAALTGHSPTDYLRIRRQVYAQNPAHFRFLRHLPIE